MKIQVQYITSDRLIAFVAGITGGSLKFMTIGNIEIIDKLFVAGATAFIWGIAGIAGKELYHYCKRKLKTKSK